MKEVIRIETKRVLSFKLTIIISLIFLSVSVFDSINSLKNYTVYDSSGNIIISSIENLKESKQDKYKTKLDYNTLKAIIDREDKSKYLYNSNLIRLIMINFKDKSMDDITETDLKKFYKQRIENIKNKLEQNNINLTSYQKEKALDNANKMDTPLKVEYAEGWKNLNNKMIDFIPIVLVIISIVIIPVFAEDPKTNMRQLYTSTFNGKTTLVSARVITGYKIGSIIYFIGIIIFSLVYLIIFGVKGSNIYIQSSPDYFLSTYNITYLQQYILNVTIGFIASISIVSLVLFITQVVEQIISGFVIVVFFWILLVMISNKNFYINHYFTNFLPYDMTNFKTYYTTNEIYYIFKQSISREYWVSICNILFSTLLTISTLILSNIKLRKKLR